MPPKTKSRRICHFPDCETIANFGFVGKPPRRCGRHREKGMVDLVHKMCIVCHISQTSYGFKPLPGEKKKMQHCGGCGEPGMINLKNPRCMEPGCDIMASYGTPKKKKQYCKSHMKEGMRDYSNKKCKYKGCGKRPSFGYTDGLKEYCKTHKLPKMESLDDRECEIPECTSKKRPSYGKPGGKPIYCANHGKKIEGAIMLTGNKCSEAGCNVGAIFGTESKKPMYCKEHKTDDCYDVMHKLCEHRKCKKRATFGIEEKKPLFCRKHSEFGMKDVSNRKCIDKRCDGETRANYGKLFGKVKYCAEHKGNNDYERDLMNPRCIEGLCKALPVYGGTNNYPLRCEEHKKDSDKNIVERECKSCGLSFILNEDSKMCYDCDSNHRVKESRKENKVVSYLRKKHYNIISTDKKTSGGCSNYRPDCVIDFGLFMCVVEIDEGQHANYKSEDEYKRMKQIYHDIGIENLMFIRFNPDRYKNHEDRKGDEPLEVRQRTIKKVIEYLLHHPETCAGLKVLYLYYDGFNPDRIRVNYFIENEEVIKLKKKQSIRF